MRLSVIVASHDAPSALERCLAALTAQDCEIVVSDSSASDPRPGLADRFPAVRWVRDPTPARALPELYWRALDQVSGEIAGLLEARSIPDRSWAEAMLRAHGQDAAAAAVGGPIAPPRRAGRNAFGYYFAEFIRFAPPLENGRRDDLSDANISFKRAFLERNRDALRFDAWPSGLLAGPSRMAADAVVEYVCPDDLRAAAGQRRRYGRGYAAARSAARSAAARALYAAGAPALPALLLLRQWREARRAGLSRDFAASLPRTLLLDAEWAAGEFLGYAFGADAGSQLR